MATGPSYLDRKPLGAPRTSVSQSSAAASAAPPSPHTPLRANAPSPFSSPGGGLRSEEDQAVLEVGARHLSAGYAGDARPKCTLRFDRDESRRVGDFRRWLPGFAREAAPLGPAAQWSAGYELWQLDLRAADLGLLEDKFERAVREAYSRHLLQDSKARRLVLAVPSVLPHAVLAVMLSALFRNFHIPAVTLLPTPFLTLVAAGQRSGLVVDVGWHETVVTTVYELREVGSQRSARAMRAVTLAMAELIELVAAGADPVKLASAPVPEGEISYDFERAEEAAARLAWCWPAAGGAEGSGDVAEIEQRLQSLNMAADQSTDGEALRSQDLEAMVALPTITSADRPLQAKFKDLALPVEHALFTSPESYRAQDDNEQAVPFLVYQVLASLSADVRSACMSNIVITGGGSHLPGVKSRIMDEVRRLVDSRGWDLVFGRASDKRREKLRELDLNCANRPQPPAQKASADVDPENEDESQVQAGLAEQEEDPIQDKLRQAAAKDVVEPVSGTLRSVETLGAWEGASIMASLRLRAVVEIDRDAYLAHGMAGAKKEGEMNAAKSRQSMGAGLARTNAADSSAWTLGPWV